MLVKFIDNNLALRHCEMVVDRKYGSPVKEISRVSQASFSWVLSWEL